MHTVDMQHTITLIVLWKMECGVLLLLAVCCCRGGYYMHVRHVYVFVHHRYHIMITKIV